MQLSGRNFIEIASLLTDRLPYAKYYYTGIVSFNFPIVEHAWDFSY